MGKHGDVEAVTRLALLDTAPGSFEKLGSQPLIAITPQPIQSVADFMASRSSVLRAPKVKRAFADSQVCCGC
jgi:hypothetical protein